MGRRRVGIFLIVFGILLAGAVGAGVYYLSQQVTETEEEMATAVVVVATIPERSVIAAPSLGLAEVPKRIVPVNAVTRVEDAAGKMSLTDMYPGDWVLRSRLADESGAAGLSFTLEPGEVVITFPPSDIINTGAVRRGDFVDLMVTVKLYDLDPTLLPPGVKALPGGVTQLTMQNLRVLAIGQVTTGAAAAETAQRTAQQQVQQLTFAVSRDDAVVLKQFKDLPDAKVEFVLRAAGDNQIYTTEAVNILTLVERYNMTPP